MKRLKNIKGKNEEQLKAIKDQGEKQLDAISKNVVLLKDGLKELIESCPNIFGTFVKNEVEQLAAKEERIDYKKLSLEAFSNGLNLLERYGTP